MSAVVYMSDRSKVINRGLSFNDLSALVEFVIRVQDNIIIYRYVSTRKLPKLGDIKVNLKTTVTNKNYIND
jgi:hypothetical protein